MVALEHGIQKGVEGVRRGATGGGFANAKLIIIRLITMVVGAEGVNILHTLDQLKLLNEELTQLNLDYGHMHNIYFTTNSRHKKFLVKFGVGNCVNILYAPSCFCNYFI